MNKVFLKLKDGKEFSGYSFGKLAEEEVGEVVFNTGIPGYQEILTDPSYNGQIVLLTSPMIGNYGITIEDMESSGVKATALLVRKLYRGPVMDGRLTLDEYLKREGISGIEGIDTRALTIYIREHGSQNGVIFTEENREKAVEKLSAYKDITELDLIDGVSVKKTVYNPELGEGFPAPPKNPARHFALVDFGVKRSIIKNLYLKNVAVTLMPHYTTAAEILSLKPDALFLSNGPGDPAYLKKEIEVIRSLVDKLPIVGICLGHQLITHALGGRTVKMKFGHHGSNHPVKDLKTGRVFVTAQNHGFMTDPESMPEDAEVWLKNANDGSIEGLIAEKHRVLSVQFHPEAAPGPEDALYIFDKFIEVSYEA